MNIDKLLRFVIMGIIIAGVCILLVLGFLASEDNFRKHQAIESQLAEQTARADKAEEDKRIQADAWNSLRDHLVRDRDSLRQQVASLTARNVALHKQLTAAQKRPVTFTVYQEKYPGSPIGKSPFALRFSAEGILRTGCGNFIFRARR